MLRDIEYFASHEVIRNDTLELGVCKSILVFRCTYMDVPCTVSEIDSVK